MSNNTELVEELRKASQDIVPISDPVVVSAAWLAFVANRLEAANKGS